MFLMLIGLRVPGQMQVGEIVVLDRWTPILLLKIIQQKSLDQAQCIGELIIQCQVQGRIFVVEIME